MAEDKRLLEKARERFKFASGYVEMRLLAIELAGALEAASVERAVVEAQALEQAAELIAERYAATQVRHASGYEEGYSDALDWAECEVRARAVEIREGRQ